jgi:hypothetical protein
VKLVSVIAISVWHNDEIREDTENLVAVLTQAFWQLSSPHKLLSVEGYKKK